MERRLLERLEAATENPTQAMWELAQFYKQDNRLDRASEVFNDLLGRVVDLEIKAQIIFSLGQTAEKSNDFELAVRFYREALAMEPCDSFTWYYIHNNLGLALAGQGCHREAAESFIAATQANAADPRSLRHLESLLTEHPELEFDFADARDACRKAVAVAKEAIEQADARWTAAARRKQLA